MNPGRSEQAGDDATNQENTPDSSRLRVSRNTANESGIPPARGDDDAAPSLRGLEHLEQAVLAIAKSEAQLAVLERGLQHAAVAAGAAGEANARLLQELDALHTELARSETEQAILRQRVAALDGALERTRSEARREREFLTVEQDRFLAEILSDQDQLVETLRERSADLSAQITALVAELDALREPVPDTELAADAAPAHRSPESDAAAAPVREYDRRQSGNPVIGSVSLRQIRVSSSPAMPPTEGAKRALIEELLDDKKAEDPRAH
jgi:chromosome segregation ATPase